MAGAEFIAGRPGEMTSYQAQNISLTAGGTQLTTQMEEGQQLGAIHEEVAQELASFVDNANRGLDRYTGTARAAGHDYANTDESRGLHISAIGNAPAGG
jgi:hypothetical protein